MKRLGVLLTALCIIFMLTPAAAAANTYPGRSTLLMDATTGTILHSENEHEPLAPASVTKVMTLLLIMEAIDSGRLNWDDTVTASETAAAKGGSQIYLKVGETMSVEEMVKSIAVSSANDCACAMAEHLAGSESAFVELMNARAAELGMEDTHFVNCTGLDDDASAQEHRTSAHDIALMSRQLLIHHPDIKKFTTIWMDSVRSGSFGLSNTNKLVRFYSGCTGLKTGFTHSAGYCLSASAQRDGMELIAVVMGCQTSDERFSSCRQMLDYGFATYTIYNAAPEKALSVPVELGTSDSVSVIPGDDTQLLVEKAILPNLTAEISLPESLSAPVSQGEQVGEICIRNGQEIYTRIRLVAADSVEKRSWFDLFLQLLGKVSMAG